MEERRGKNEARHNCLAHFFILVYEMCIDKCEGRAHEEHMCEEILAYCVVSGRIFLGRSVELLQIRTIVQLSVVWA